jgi:hypothetical protein
MACSLASALPRWSTVITSLTHFSARTSLADGGSESGSAACTAAASSQTANDEKSPPAPHSASACAITRPTQVQLFISDVHEQSGKSVAT